MLLFVCIISAIYLYQINLGEAFEFGPISPFFNMTYYTLGWSYFLFEGITNVLPIMNASEKHVHANFHFILAAALITLAVIYGGFGFIGYLRYGRGTPVDLLNQFFKD